MHTNILLVESILVLVALGRPLCAPTPYWRVDHGAGGDGRSVVAACLTPLGIRPGSMLIQPPDYGLDPSVACGVVPEVQLRHDGSDVGFHGSAGQGHLLGDGGVGHALRHELQHGSFPVGQALEMVESAVPG